MLIYYRKKGPWLIHYIGLESGPDLDYFGQENMRFTLIKDIDNNMKRHDRQVIDSDTIHTRLVWSIMLLGDWVGDDDIMCLLGYMSKITCNNEVVIAFRFLHGK